jgi:hypothetical protein
MLVAESEYPFADLMWTFFIFFGLILFSWLLITVFGDLFRRDDISGWGKAAWSVFVIFVPILGSLVYLIAQGRGMAERERQQVETAQRQTDEYIRSVSSNGYRGADEIARAKELLDRGAITPEEFQRIKQRALI